MPSSKRPLRRYLYKGALAVAQALGSGQITADLAATPLRLCLDRCLASPNRGRLLQVAAKLLAEGPGAAHGVGAHVLGLLGSRQLQPSSEQRGDLIGVLEVLVRQVCNP